MTRILFLLGPVIFSGLCLLIGETINGLKKKRQDFGFNKMTVLTNARRK